MKSFICSIILFSCLGNHVNAQESISAEGEGKSVLKVNLDKVSFEDFLGVNAVYHGFAWMPEIEASGYDESDRQQEMDRVEEMNLHIARTWVPYQYS
ncbi:MAG: hypothetical protein GY790_19170 [Bacteroidetes bacterium]|nr:hypothetical protein [Bacteroidota bacterium]